MRSAGKNKRRKTKMKSKKVTMLAAALVVAVVALAGVGYATQYTATTNNTENTAQAAYLIIEQTGNAATYDDDWLTKVFFDTVNTGSGTHTYTLKKEYGVNNGTISTSAETKDMALISVPLGISITKHNSGDNALDITISTSDLKTSTQIAGLEYWIALGDVTSVTGGYSMANAKLAQGNVGADGTVWTFAGDSAISATGNSVTFSLLMFIKGAPTASPGEYAGFSEESAFSIVAEASE